MSFTSFSYKYYTSHPSPRTDVDFPYLIPLKDGTKTITIPVVHLNSILNRGTPSNWYCTSFKANQGDTVFASRAGVVVESNASQTVKDVYFNDNENYISILQEDGTLARYSNFDINKVFPYTGERIFAAQPIGIVATNRSENGSYINMTVFHASTEDKEPVCILTKFCASGVKPEILLPNNNYTVHHYPEVITLGMSRKMKKKFLRE